MKDIEKAINAMKNIENYWTYRPSEVEAAKLAIAALEKQIPKKPIIKEWNIAKCPCCGAGLGEWLIDGYHKDYTNLKICDCGQKLDWEA